MGGRTELPANAPLHCDRALMSRISVRLVVIHTDSIHTDENR
jgi:hypothetical protein